MKAKKVFTPETRERIVQFITELISQGACYNSLDFLLDSLSDDIKRMRESLDATPRRAEIESAIMWCEVLCKQLEPLRGKYKSVKNPYDEGLAAYNALAQIRMDLIERFASKEFHRYNDPDEKTMQSDSNVNYELLISITSGAMNNLHRQIDAAASLHSLNVILGIYDDMQNNRITPHLTDWSKVPGEEPKIR